MGILIIKLLDTIILVYSNANAYLKFISIDNFFPIKIKADSCFSIIEIKTNAIYISSIESFLLLIKSMFHQMLPMKIEAYDLNNHRLQYVRYAMFLSFIQCVEDNLQQFSC